MSTGLVADARFTAHDPGPGHPERVERFEAVMCALEKAGLSQRLTPIECKVARQETIERCHECLYLEVAEEEILAGRSWLSTGSVIYRRFSLADRQLKRKCKGCHNFLATTTCCGFTCS